jgi:hypothetical protein
LAIGELNAAGGDFPLVCATSIGAAARWMWYNPDPSTIADPFTASPPRQLLLFRLPVTAVTGPTAYYVNKDIKNTTAVTANGIELLIAGHHTYNDIFHATTPTFTVTLVGANDRLDWTGGSFPPNAVVHVGFRTNDVNVQILSVAIVDNAFNVLGCGRQLSTGIHTNANLKWSNDVTGCQLTPPPPLFIRGVALEYYPNEIALSDLNATAVRSPMHVDSIAAGLSSIAVGDTAGIAIPAGPSGAKWVVIHQRVGTTTGATETEDWIEVPLAAAVTPTAVPISSNVLLTLVGLGLLGLGVLGIRRNRLPA